MFAPERDKVLNINCNQLLHFSQVIYEYNLVEVLIKTNEAIY